MKLLYGYSESVLGHIDLASLSYNDLQTVAADILSISVAVDNGFMAKIDGYETLTSNK
ncbi:hypothetical protein MASR1M36_08420 [Candidatus Cloacimonadaceae bacterium]